MKIIAFILATYIGALAFVPCADGLMSACSGNSDIENTTTNAGHDHSHDQDDDCTPFCTCICCGSVIAFPLTIATNNKINFFIVAEISFHYDFNYAFDYKDGVWRPPTYC